MITIVVWSYTYKRHLSVKSKHLTVELTAQISKFLHLSFGPHTKMDELHLTLIFFENNYNYTILCAQQRQMFTNKLRRNGRNGNSKVTLQIGDNI